MKTISRTLRFARAMFALSTLFLTMRSGASAGQAFAEQQTTGLNRRRITNIELTFSETEAYRQPVSNGELTNT
jgi:hypothetical protein